jgi:hypothetical protein
MTITCEVNNLKTQLDGLLHSNKRCFDENKDELSLKVENYQINGAIPLAKVDMEKIIDNLQSKLLTNIREEINSNKIHET